MKIRNGIIAAGAAMAALAVTSVAAMAEDIGISHKWQLGYQEPATPVMAWIEDLHMNLLYVITAITLFVMALLLYVFIRYNARSNPTPSTTTHNTFVEIVWTIVPVGILVAIAIPSLKLLYFEDKAVNPEFTLKATGNQWYWSYEYPDHGGLSFDAVLVKESELKPGQHRLLETDNHVVVPVNATVRVLTTATDVIHAWAIPSFGVKMDAVPGRTNETWFRATREGTYYGQCSELCGKDHGYMPIVVDVVSRADFNAWVKQAQEQQASVTPSSPVQVADASLAQTR